MQPILGVAIGLVLVFAVFAVVASAVTETISALVRKRARDLEEGLARMLDGGQRGAVTEALIANPLIVALTRDRKAYRGATAPPGPDGGAARFRVRTPSYIDAVTFATALLDEGLQGPRFVGDGVAPVEALTDAAAIERRLHAIAEGNTFVGPILVSLWNRSERTLGSLRHEVEDWFDREMARVSGWYARWSQICMFVVALILAVGLNVSATTIGRNLWADPTLRENVEAVASQATGQPAPPEAGQPALRAAPSFADLDAAGLPLGWTRTAWPGSHSLVDLVIHLIGVVAVAISASFGAPFWFDLLNRVVNLRIAGPKPATGAEQRAGAPPAGGR